LHKHVDRLRAKLPEIMRTICHELGHKLNTRDLYDYEGEHSSLGNWCLDHSEFLQFMQVLNDSIFRLLRQLSQDHFLQ
jgi:hypothetical protein